MKKSITQKLSEERLKNARFKDLPLNCKLTPELLEMLKVEIARGMPVHWARKVVGLSRWTYYDWIKKGKKSEDPTDPYRVFFEEMELAKALAIGSRVETIRRASDEHWQAAAWYLERIDHDHFGRKSVIDANVNNTVKQVNLAEMFDKNEIKQIISEEEEDDD